ncbi:MAG: hypothetical protein EP332_08870 [Bacteroidetes bacterium]|nr:MAG: hypothetical protein EP332_08870 [Bacteroidota bacterium]
MTRLSAYFLSFAVVITFLIFAFGSATQKAPPVNYGALYVPQESGYKFYKITDDLDGICSGFGVGYQRYYSNLNTNIIDVSRSEKLITYQGVSSKNGSREANMYLRKTESVKLKQQRTFQPWTFGPAISQDDKMIAYSQTKDNKTNIYIVGAESGAKIQQVTNTSTFTNNPVFFPDNSKVLFTEREKVGQVYNAKTQQYDNTYDRFLWSYDLKKGTLIQYGKGSQADFFPDGQQVVCVRNDYELWILNLETGQEYSLLSDNIKGYAQPVVSPDGKRVAFVSLSVLKDKTNNWDIFTINADGTGMTQITFHHGNDFNPKWSKDGKSLYFVSQRGSGPGNYNIWKVTIE